MRNRLMLGTAALLLASASVVWAQDKPQQTSPSSGTISVGGRFTSTDGDEARYERYQDLRNGANVNILYNRTTENWTFDLSASNIGYRDGNYVANFNSRRIRASVMFDQTPLNYMYGARTPYVCTAGNCGLDAGLRAQIQAARGTRLNPTTGAYAPVNTTPIGVPQNVAQLTPGGSIYNSIARSFDMQQRRDTISADLVFSATDNLNLIFGFDSFKRGGNMPWGASFAFPVGVELPLVIDNRTTDINAAVEWASHQGTMRMGYTHSKFDQKIPTLTWDNPLYATDFNVFSPQLGVSYDPSGYSSSAGGAAFGRMAMAPTNTLTTFDWLGMIKLPGRTTANATFAMSANRQNEALIPWTTNSTVNQPSVWAAFPELRHLPRETADMRVNYATGTFNVTSRPIRNLSLNARYRFNSRNDFTRPFEAVEYVRFDAVPEETGGAAEPFSINRNTVDVNASYALVGFSTVRVGHTYDRWEHTIRATQAWRENTTRVSADVLGTRFMTVRAQWEHSKRDAIETDIEEITGAGGQPALRFYDEGSRKRNRGSFILEFNPVAMVGVNASFSAGKDDYAGADSTMRFGLLDNNNTGLTVGVTVTPNAKVNFGADYGRETYEAQMRSRNANPAPDASWTDPNRDWLLDQDETVNNATVYVNLAQVLAKTDVRVAYDYSDSDQGYIHSGPRISTLAGLGTFIALPNVTNKWQRVSFDLTRMINAKVGVGFAYYYEKFDVSDWATINTAGPQSLPVASLGAQTDQPRLDYLGGLLTGYGNRPYKGQTGYIRLFYSF